MLNLRYFLNQCLEDCGGGPDSKTWERSAVGGIHRPISLLLSLVNWRKKSFPPDSMTFSKLKRSSFRSSTGSALVSPLLINYSESLSLSKKNNMGQCTAAVFFLDIQKAFDRVWHTGLLFKLINL
ncbi:hypothetical protein TNCV_788711 [Trichonephila clavipes]|nr:hypothetical protein TNCV_788711 [Trichonephila clavipes]